MSRPSGLPARIRPAIAVAGLLGLASVAVGASAASAEPVSPTEVVQVLPGDFSMTNVSADRPTAIWDGVGFDEFTDLPAAGSKWVLDIEDKSPGSWSIDDDGLTITLPEEDPEATAKSKVRLQYYVGTGGFPMIDDQAPVLSDLFGHPFSWEQEQLLGSPTYGITLEIQLQKEVSAGEYDRVTVVSRWDAAPETRDFAAGLWWANDPTPGNGLGQWNGVDATSLLAEYGDFEVVSFGPNLGSGWNESTRIQDFSILGATFHFTPAAPTTPVTPVDPEDFDEGLEFEQSFSTATESGVRIGTFELGPDFANQWWKVIVNSTPIDLGWFLADSDGVIKFPLPDTLEGGEHTAAVYGQSGSLSAWAGFTVEGAALAETGIDVGLALPVIALLLATAGVVILASQRRRARRV